MRLARLTICAIALLLSVVAFGGSSAADPAPTQLTSIANKTWIWPRAARGGRFLGYVRVGHRVRLRSPEPVAGVGCPGGFFAIEPRGYVCNDRTVTLERESAWIRANAHTLPRGGPFPYHFALSNGAPMYSRIPTPGEQKKIEWRYGKSGEFVPLPLFQRGHEHLAVSEPIAARDPVPEFLAGGLSARGTKAKLLRRTIPHGAMLAYTRSFDAAGRTFLLSTDLTLVPADRVRKFERSSFAGTMLGNEVKLPIAWMRSQARPRYRLLDGHLVESGEPFVVRSFVQLSGEEQQQDGRRFLRVAGDGGAGDWVAADDATVVRARDKRPFGVAPGEKWIIVSITQGTLVAYDDLNPVYATLISPGQGGVPRKGGDPVKDSTTPLGTYRITFKDRAATMSPEFGEDRSFWIADVPYTQYFKPPFALHAAYWHERFGEYMSGGCVNASPVDAEWLFSWTEPHVPEGWQGATGAGAKENGRASWIVVTR